MIFFLPHRRATHRVPPKLWGRAWWLAALLALCMACDDTRTASPEASAPRDDGASEAASAEQPAPRPSANVDLSEVVDSTELEVILGIREPPPFRLDDLITREDLIEHFTLHAPTTRGTLEGTEKSPYYNDLRYHRPDSEGLGVVLQYWHFGNRVASTTHFEMLQRGTATEAKPVGVASNAFYDEVGGVTRLVSHVHELDGVIALSCDLSNCHVPQLMRLTELIIRRMNE